MSINECLPCRRFLPFLRCHPYRPFLLSHRYPCRPCRSQWRLRPPPWLRCRGPRGQVKASLLKPVVPGWDWLHAVCFGCFACERVQRRMIDPAPTTQPPWLLLQELCLQGICVSLVVSPGIERFDEQHAHECVQLHAAHVLFTANDRRRSSKAAERRRFSTVFVIRPANSWLTD